eukprot:2914792-Prymnesium_polylepis.1
MACVPCRAVLYCARLEDARRPLGHFLRRARHRFGDDRRELRRTRERAGGGDRTREAPALAQVAVLVQHVRERAHLPVIHDQRRTRRAVVVRPAALVHCTSGRGDGGRGRARVSAATRLRVVGSGTAVRGATCHAIFWSRGWRAPGAHAMLLGSGDRAAGSGGGAARALRMSSGPSRMKEKPRSAASSWCDETPMSSSSPSIQPRPGTAQGSAHSTSRIAPKFDRISVADPLAVYSDRRSPAARSASVSRSSAINRPPFGASTCSSASEWPPPPSVPST